MAIGKKIISFWKQVRLRSSDMFTLFKVGVGIKVPTHKLHIKDSTDPIKVEGVQSDTSSSTKFLVLDGSDVVKHTTAGGKTTEEVQDIVGAMFTSNTETGIAATYEDSDGTIDLVVSGVTDLHTAGVDGAANQLLTDDGDGTVTSESHLTFESSTLELGGDTFDSFNIQRKNHSDNIGGELRIFSGAGGGTNKAGGDLIFKSGKGTGNALGGAIEFYVSTAGSSGDTAHFLQAIDMKITDGLVHVTGNITLTGTVDGIDIATDVAANTAKVDLTVNGAGTIHANNVPTLNQSTTGNATTATVAATSAITDAAAASTTYYPVLVDGFTGFQALEAESELTFVGNTGILTATGFAGALTGDVTGNADTATTLTAGNKSINGTFQSKGFIQDDDRNLTIGGDGHAIHVDASDLTDDSTSASGTNGTYNHITFENPRLLATNSSVTTTNASTVFIKGAPVASTNQTITNAYALYVFGGDSYFGGNIIAGNNIIKDDDGVTCITFDSSGNTTIANTLNATLTGNVTGNTSGSSGSCTGQAATVATIAGLAPNTATTAAAQPNITSLHSSIAITKQVKVTLSTADCNALHTTPIELVAAQGADTVIVPTGGMIRVDRALTQGQSSADVNFHYADKEPGTAGQSSVAHYRRFMYNESGDRVFHISPAFFYSEVSQNLTDDVNKALEVSVDSAFTNNCFTSIDIYLTYNVFDIS